MEKQVPKSKFKPHALQFSREVEQTGVALIITDRGKPVLKIVPYSKKPAETLRILRNSVLKYENPTDSVGLNDWETLMGGSPAGRQKTTGTYPGHNRLDSQIGKASVFSMHSR